eukprot:TRINITY_DN4569_c0_g1_i1.p1 TRINITY_DN4569_c0_g1~~TRINITY_DN4569_c0_g1_i1.p1  ORF type:complete len:214 (+),score=36.38 TRINITY_DN4569_c0_g1_i1:37-678(+)
MEDDKELLTYQDTTLYVSDLRLICGNNWLNDRVISFYLDYLSDEISNQNIFFVNPSTVMLMNFTSSEELQSILSSLELDKKDIVFVPVNDNQDITSAGGSHWSSLVYVNETKTFYALDSYDDSNHAMTMSVFKKLSGILPGTVKYLSMPKQTNGYDCGMYVLAAAKLLSDNPSLFKNDIKSMNAVLSEKITPKNVKDLRMEIVNIISRLAKNK